MKVELGFLTNRQPFNWDLIQSANFHSIITGYSGAGKTYTINKIIKRLSTEQDIKRIYIFDVHGDIGDELDPRTVSTVKFTETAGNGINPLEISSNPEYGGPRKKINEFIKMLNKTGSKLGSRQVAALSRYLQVVYNMKGIKMKDTSTWRKKSPTLTDLKLFLQRSMDSLELSTNYKTAMKLDAVNDNARKIASLTDDETPEKEDKLTESKQMALEAYTDFLATIKTGEEMRNILDAKKSSGTMIESILDRIQTLEESGVFSAGGSSFDTSKKIFRFDLRTLSLDEKIIFIDTMSKKIYDHSISKGITDRAREIMVIDEASDFVDHDKDSVYNKIAIGSRKYGLGMLMASQSIHHFPDDILMNSAMKVILGVDSLFTKQVSNKIRVNEDQIKFLKPKVSALAMVRSKDPLAPEGWQNMRLQK